MWKIWVLISGFFVILEIITVGFLVFWFAIGALFAMITSIFIDNIVAQTIVFLITSSILILLTRPLVEKFTKKDIVKTNAYSIIGKKAIVTKNIDFTNSSGQIKINGEIWSARSSEQGHTYEKGSEVEIVSIDGVKAVIK